VSFTTLGDPPPPLNVVQGAIQAAQEDKLERFLTLVDVVSIQGQAEQPRSQQQLIQLLKSIDLKTLKMDAPQGDYEKGERIQVSVRLPVEMRFIVLYTGLRDRDRRYRIVEVYKGPAPIIGAGRPSP
jgi:hypothetical protein